MLIAYDIVYLVLSLDSDACDVLDDLSSRDKLDPLYILHQHVTVEEPNKTFADQ